MQGAKEEKEEAQEQMAGNMMDSGMMALPAYAGHGGLPYGGMDQGMMAQGMGGMPGGMGMPPPQQFGQPPYMG
eukprot:SAG11_NODE_1546_length_4715_cov_2.708406_1_plen_73_part_00